VSAVESAAARVESALGAAERLNPQLNAYLHLDAEGARAAAAVEDARDAARGGAPDPARPLTGMPICVKDIVDVVGMPTTAGGADWVRHPEADATVVVRLRAAGAIVIGKGNTNEFACGIDGRNPHKGDCRNPYDPTRLAGGSSSGPAATVAAGMADGGVGTDTSGSIRVPAALCGVVGIRPTRGLVPADGVVPLAWSLDAVGPLARDVATAALLLDIFAGRPPAPAPRPDAAGLRLGLATELLDLAEQPVAEAIDAAVAGLRAEGAEIVDCPLPDLERATAIHRIVQAAEVAAAHAPWFERQRDLYAPEVRARIEPGYSLRAEAYLRAQRHRRLFTREFATAMNRLDAAQPARLPRRLGAGRAARGPAGRPAADRPPRLRAHAAADRRDGRRSRRGDPAALVLGGRRTAEVWRVAGRAPRMPVRPELCEVGPASATGPGGGSWRPTRA
jgi:aspartyl-tRNA(Asn)/glutamyl-tRNA(Gln) amidotransferase subunit A